MTRMGLNVYIFPALPPNSCIKLLGSLSEKRTLKMVHLLQDLDNPVNCNLGGWA